jgi:hypothetical protein
MILQLHPPHWAVPWLNCYIICGPQSLHFQWYRIYWRWVTYDKYKTTHLAVAALEERNTLKHDAGIGFFSLCSTKGLTLNLLGPTLITGPRLHSSDYLKYHVYVTKIITVVFLGPFLEATSSSVTNASRRCTVQATARPDGFERLRMVASIHAVDEDDEVLGIWK